MHFVESVQIRNIRKCIGFLVKEKSRVQKSKSLKSTALPAMSPLKKQELTASLASDVPWCAVRVYNKKDYLTYVIL